MFGSIPKIFGKGFLVGFLLPATLFTIFMKFSALTYFFPIKKLSENIVENIAYEAIFIISISVLLIALNRPIIRLLQGYGKVFTRGPFTKLASQLHFTKYILPLFQEAKRIDEQRAVGVKAKATDPDFSKKLFDAIGSFPDTESAILPTKFGNTMRAFEVYSRVVYGLDVIPAWPRLFMILPKRIRDQIDANRSIIDFNANIFMFSIISLIVLLAKYFMLLYSDSVIASFDLYYFLLPLVVAIYAWIALPQSAKQWGEIVKSAFDLYRGRLASQMGLSIPENIEDERVMWQEVSRQMIYRSSFAANNTNKFRKKSKTQGKLSRNAKME